MSMRIVVTGASGFLGKHVAQYLRDSEADVLAVSRRAYDGCLQVQDYTHAPEGDVLIHLAQDSDRSRVNESGEAAAREADMVMHSLLNRKYDRVVYASSATLYGDGNPGLRKPTDPIMEEDEYARLKRQSEIAVMGSGHGVVARLSNLYGVGMSTNNVLWTILRQIPGQGALRVMDDTPVRDFLWVKDAAAAISRMAMGKISGIFNVGSGVGTSIRQLANLCLEEAGETQRPVIAMHRSNRRSSLVLDLRETMVNWDWKPVVTLRDGVKCLLETGSQQT